VFSPDPFAVEVTRRAWTKGVVAPFAQKILSILLDTRAHGEQDDDVVSPFEARLLLPSPNAVSLKAKLRIER
jgi:hypothetical protein